MPTYQYQCKNCGHEFEELQSFSEPTLVQCPECHKDTLARVLGGGGGLIFKGTGFYLTDYKSSGDKKETKPEKKEEKKDEKKSDTPPPSSSSSDSKSKDDKAPPPPPPPPAKKD